MLVSISSWQLIIIRVFLVLFLSTMTTTTPPLYYHIKPYRENELWIWHRNTLLKHFSSMKWWFSCMLIGNKSSVKCYLQLPTEYKSYFENIFYATFVASETLVLSPEKALTIPQLSSKTTTYIILPPKSELQSKSDFSKDGSYMDPLKDVLSLFESIDITSTLTLRYDYVFWFTKTRRQELTAFLSDGWKAIRWSNQPATPEKEWESKESEISKDPNVFLSLSYQIDSPDQSTQEQVKMHIQSVYSLFLRSGSIKIDKKSDYKGMTRDEAVNFFHLPTKENYTKNLDYITYRKLPYPADMPTVENSEKNKVTLIGMTDYKWEHGKFGIRAEDKFRHMYIVGKTGTGKSTFISNMIKSDMITNNGICLIDPHGDLVETVLEHVPSYRINDVILFDIADTDYPIGFNLLQFDNEGQKNLIVSGVVSTFEKLYGNSRWPRLEYILRFVMLAIVEYPNATLLHITRMLTDANFRNDVLSHNTDALILKFWKEEFGKWTDKFREEAIAPIMNKVWQFLSSKMVRNIFSQPQSKLNIRKAMDEGKILLVNLSKGKIWEDNANMIGSFLVTKLQTDAMSRADIAFKDRRDFFCYIDEFQNFATKSFAVIFSEARKYKLWLIVANQYTSQLDPLIKDAIFGNVGTIISFTLWHDDAEVMSSQFKWMLSANDFISLPKFKGYVKLMIDGMTSDPFNMQTIPLPTPELSVETKEKILTQSRQRYAIAREELETLLTARSAKTFSAQEKIMEKAAADARIYAQQQAAGITTSITTSQTTATTPSSLQTSTQAWGQATTQPAITQPPISTTITHPTTPSPSIASKPPTTPQRTNRPGITPPAKPSITQTTQTIQQPSQTPTTPPSTQVTQPKSITPAAWVFGIDSIVLGQSYEWYIKLSYNYGLFVTVMWVEWLLHKNFVKAPEGVAWKKFYNIWDKITVIAHEFKDINGEKRVVWTM